ncbi:ras GTPase-activating protein 3-like isoform X2 [Ruditapes philippinarum]|uniref:ras GTPase-activating protein 3-like isoform X2 n=1 Tax=Ruditapes philippinarum TaxID=129788 RepID=UPI00295B2A0F|nr:ras GTPase-activating protein 3-like isoform X2 [Ruditapes philippinarum]
MKMASKDVRITESLRVKIGEAKNLPGGNGSAKNTFCTLSLDREEIYRTAVVEKCSNPFYGEEFHGEIPRQFRYLSCYVYEKPDKVIGKVSLLKKELHKYHGKEHWFPILPLEANSEVQGKVHLELRFEECLTCDPDHSVSHRLAVRIVECTDLPVTNGACNPYAVVTLCYGKIRYREDVKRTNVKKKTICPQFEETFFFDMENKGQNHDRHNYYIEDIFSGDLRVSLWHDDSRVSREVLGGMFPGVYLGEVKIPLRDLDTSSAQNSWYFLRPNLDFKPASEDFGSIRLKVSYNTEHVFSSQYYDDLRNILLQSSDIQPISSSAACILGRVVDHLQEAAQPLVRVFLHHGKIVPFMEALASYEIKHTLDHHTLFRGNTLLTKMLDELMKLVGLPYLHHILKPTIQQICTEHLPCEIDPTKLQDSENINGNLDNLCQYIEQIFVAITSSGLVCPTDMSQVFHTLKQAACCQFPETTEVKYQVVSGFVFLRYFAPAILGPRFFDLIEDTVDATTNRTLTLISKAIQGLGNLVCSKSWSFCLKEEYMVPLFRQLSDEAHIEAIKMYLDIISSSTKAHSSHQGIQEVPVVLKQGMLIKRAQGRKKFGVKNFKQRYFCLTNKSLTYSKYKGGIPLCEIPVEDILAVEKLEEQSFKMKYMFQVVQPSRALYVQASNCIEEKEWLDVLMKVSAANQNRLNLYHPAAFINGHWLCCKEQDQTTPGCSQVSGYLPLANVQVDIDSDREIEKLHALLLNNMDKLEAMQDACGAMEVYAGNQFSIPVEIEDSKSCFEMLNEMLKCVIGLEQEHMQYQKTVQKQHVKGSFESPIGDDSLLVAAPETGTKL